MSKYRCIGCGRSWRLPLEDKNYQTYSDDEEIQDFCPVCASQSIDDLVKEMKERRERDKRMREGWKERKVNR